MSNKDPFSSDEGEEEPLEDAPPPPPAESYKISLSPRAAGALGKPAAPSDMKGRDTRQLPRVSMKRAKETTMLTEDDITEDTVIGPAAGFVRNVYATSAKMSPRHLAIAESAARDALALQSAAHRDALTASFQRQGVSWHAGYSSDLGQTPLGHAISPAMLPEPGDSLEGEAVRKAGIVLYAVNPHLSTVLEHLLPTAFAQAMAQARGKRTCLLQVCIFYLPGTQDNTVGFVHEFLHPKFFDKRFYLYVQTGVRKAPVDILDNVLESLQDGLPAGERPDDFTVAERITLAKSLSRVGAEVEESLRQVTTSVGGFLPYRAVVLAWRRLAASLPGLFDEVDRVAARAWNTLKAQFMGKASPRPGKPAKKQTNPFDQKF